jgi:formylmethanofuran dehydrogenase subunit E
MGLTKESVEKDPFLFFAVQENKCTNICSGCNEIIFADSEVEEKGKFWHENCWKKERDFQLKL